MTFGTVLTFYRGSDPALQKLVSSRYGVSDVVCGSWLRVLNTVRNICAHHARLWNRVLGVKPMIPNKDVRWNRPVPIPNDRVFSVLTICRHCLGVIAPGSDWTDRLKSLLTEFPDVPRPGLGLIPNWDKHPMWL